MKDYFIANELRDVFSSYELGYQYPETPFKLANNPPALAAFAREQVNALYGPQLKVNEGFTKQPLVGLPKLEGAAAHYRTEWVAFVRAKRFAIPGSWNIFIFLGEPNADPSKWALESVGTVAVFAPRNIGFCKNCLSQEGAGMEVSGVVYLTDALSRKVGEELEEDKVVEYLTENLHWRVGKVSHVTACSIYF
jgi:tyrosinase